MVVYKSCYNELTYQTIAVISARSFIEESPSPGLV